MFVLQWGYNDLLEKAARYSMNVSRVDDGILHTVGVTIDFGGLRALNQCSISVRRGTVTGLIGPNGAGKTTLFNVITGFQRLDEGEVWFRGERIDRFQPHQIFRKRLMRTFQISRELQKMTLLENLMLVPSGQVGEQIWISWIRPRAVRRQEGRNRERAMEVLELLQLGDLWDEYAGNLSTGQKKILELGRAMMADPEMILLDEPGAGVNPTLMRKLVGYIREINRQGKTFLLIEHDMDLVMNLCQPIVVMNVGGKLTEGPAEKIRCDPRVLEAYLGES
jgi:branched-chain amino acid transport system ATP-binding protein